MVLGQRIWHEHIRADLTAPGDLRLVALDVLDFIEMLTFLDLEQLRLEHGHRHLAVLVLAALVLAGHHDAGGDVGQTHGGGGFIDMLAAGAGRAEHIHFDVFGTDVDLDGVVEFRHDLQRGKGGVPASGGVKRRDAHQAVHAGFPLEIAVHIFSLDHNGGAFQAGLVAVEIVEDLIAETVALRPVGIHAIQHFRPVLRLGAAGARMEG